MCKVPELTRMKPMLFMLLILSGMLSLALPPLLQAGSIGDRVHYVGGTVAALPHKSEGRIQITDTEAMLFLL